MLPRGGGCAATQTPLTTLSLGCGAVQADGTVEMHDPLQGSVLGLRQINRITQVNHLQDQERIAVSASVIFSSSSSGADGTHEEPAADICSTSDTSSEDSKELVALAQLNLPAENTGLPVADAQSETQSEAQCTAPPPPLEFTEPDLYGQRHPIEDATLSSKHTIEHSLRDFRYRTRHIREAPSTTNAFRLMFLRCECYNVKKAAQRYQKYWDARVALFQDRAYLPLTAASMLPHDQVPLERGSLQILKSSSNRDMLWLDPGLLDPTAYSSQSGCRALWYIFHALLQDDMTVQQHGVVLLAHLPGFSLSKRDSTLTRMCIRSLKGCLPVRLSALHTLEDPPGLLYRCVAKFVCALLGERLRQRVVTHAVLDLDRLERQYGISRESLPAAVGGMRKLDPVAWLQEQVKAGK